MKKQSIMFPFLQVLWKEIEESKQLYHRVSRDIFQMLQSTEGSNKLVRGGNFQLECGNIKQFFHEIEPTILFINHLDILYGTPQIIFNFLNCIRYVE